MVGRQTPRPHPATFANVLTPERIPEFCIPPRHQSQRVGPHHVSIPDLTGSLLEAPKPCSLHVIQVDSVEESSAEEKTNADPQSQAALSLPHLLKAQTCYGFCTLLESPNTRRKESLFHNELDNPAILLPRSRSNTVSCRETSSPNKFPGTSRPLRRSGTLDSDTTSSADSSPLSSPLLYRSLPTSLLKALSQEKISRALKVGCKSAFRNNSLSTDDESSTDSSPCVTRRSSQEWPPHAQEWPQPLYPHAGLLIAPKQFPLDNTLSLDTGGILRMSTEYRAECLRLRIRLVSAEGLYRESTDPKHINCTVYLSIEPGKSQKQRSTSIRGSRNPIFNEDFFFEGLQAPDLLQKTLKIKAVNKGSGVRRETVLGRSKLHLLSVLL